MIQNITTKEKLASVVSYCDSNAKKARGLMFTSKKTDFGMVFPYTYEKIISLHMFFVFYPIDVLFLDLKGKVVDIKRGFRPFTLYTPSVAASTIIELPEGAADTTRIGHSISF